MNKRVLLTIILWFGLVGMASAQTATQSAKLGWDQDAIDLATAQAYTYRTYADGSASGVVLTGVTCAATATAQVFFCQLPFPAFTPGAHALQVSATNVAGESLKSTPLNFTFVIIPATPRNLRVAP